MSQGATAERLSRERILDAASALVGREGLDGLSMRRLAQQLDVWPMSLYRYFHDKEELVAALADAAAASVASPAGPGPWREQVGDLLVQARAIFARHPGGLGPRSNGPASARVHDAGVAILTRAGFRGEAESAWRALLAYAAGAAAFGSSAEDFDYGLARLLDGLETRLAARPPRT